MIVVTDVIVLGLTAVAFTEWTQVTRTELLSDREATGDWKTIGDVT